VKQRNRSDRASGSAPTTSTPVAGHGSTAGAGRSTDFSLTCATKRLPPRKAAASAMVGVVFGIGGQCRGCHLRSALSATISAHRAGVRSTSMRSIEFEIRLWIAPIFTVPVRDQFGELCGSAVPREAKSRRLAIPRSNTARWFGQREHRLHHVQIVQPAAGSTLG